MVQMNATTLPSIQAARDQVKGYVFDLDDARRRSPPVRGKMPRVTAGAVVSAWEG